MIGRSWILYGAYGYTGRLIAAEARARGMKPILAGRNIDKLQALGTELGLTWRAFPLQDAETVARELDGVSLVLNVAGPFSSTAAPMLRGCLAARSHYVDISGELDVLEWVQQQDGPARRAGVVLCPGAGFDTISMDCLASALKSALPDATSLALAFQIGQNLSAGSARTVIEGLGKGGRVRRDGKLEAVPLAHQARQVDFGYGPCWAVAVPWGDVATAFYSTRIPNIETYLPLPLNQVRLLRMLRHAQPLLGRAVTQRLLKGWVERNIAGPSEEERARTPAYCWGEVRNDRGEVRIARLRTVNSYDFTVAGTLAVVEKLLRLPHPPGAYTPAQLMGKDFVSSLPGSSGIELAA